MLQPLEVLLAAASQHDASDLHLSPGMPWLRVHGQMQRLTLQTGPLTGDQIVAMLCVAMDERDREKWERGTVRSLDFGFGADGLGRFRANLALTTSGPTAVLRRVPATVPTADDLGLPAEVAALADLPSGLILVTGATGEGKSSTLAALVDRINRTRNGHILTLEEPVEYEHTPKHCRITHREIGIHAESFEEGLGAALRQDPDVIVVGEARTGREIEKILQAAETGHLVMATLHTINSVNAISRVVGMVETARQPEVRTQLAECLRAVVTQRLVPTVDGRRTAAFELLVNTRAIASNIAAGNTTDMRSALESRRDGMRTLEQSLAELVLAGHVEAGVAGERANDLKAFQRALDTATSPGYR